ncbi:MAG: hypothetical protein ABS75_32920 [Pelagibacterium sp. SCN 63-23]|nr:MAG: hypothetical protein ABS75_32920 [Pelagibacterium sp. SCN 63-23]
MTATKTLRRLRLVLWSLVVVAAIGAGYLLLDRPATTAQAAAWYAQPFKLVDQTGAPVTEATYLGKPSVWFYGFTHCPDVCPTTLSEISVLLDALGADAERLNAVFVSVDPERDSPEIMRDYVDYFDARIIGLTGELAEVSKMARDRHIFFEKIPLEGDDYTMEHQATMQLVDADGRFFGTLASEEGFDTRLAKLRRLIGG